MNHLSKISSGFIVFAALFFSSCTKVIDLDLNSANAQIVVEAKLSDDATQKGTVRLSKTINFSESNTFPPLSNAVVFIKNRTTGEVDTLKETSTAGFYQGSKLVGKIGNTYDLTIQAEGKTITASSTIPRKVNLDSITFIKQSLFGNSNIQAIPRYTDLVGIGDNYRFVMSVNGNTKSDLFIQNDELSDGQLNGRPLFSGGGSNADGLKVGDFLTLEMYCLDEGAYTYFSTLDGGGGGPNSSSATPTNPTSNLKGAILGYFSAYTTQTKSVIVK